MKTMSKILATILIVVLCVSLFTVQAFAENHASTAECQAYLTANSLTLEDHSGEAVAPTCTEDGIKAYYKCPGCDRCYDGPDLSTANYLSSLVDPATGHDFDGQTPTDATCFSPEKTKCKTCGEEIETGPKLSHALGTEHAATVGKDCKTNGTIKYYDCANGCGAFLNEAGDVITTAMINSGERGAHNLKRAPTRGANGRMRSLPPPPAPVRRSASARCATSPRPERSTLWACLRTPKSSSP